MARVAIGRSARPARVMTSQSYSTAWIAVPTSGISPMMIGGRWAKKGITGCNLRETGSKLARPTGVVGAAVAEEVAAEVAAEAVEAVVADHPITEV